MAYDEGLASRVRSVLSKQKGLVEKKMFGGLAFMLRGNMCLGVLGDELIVRVGPDGHAEATSMPHTRAFDFTGRPMKGFVVVKPKGCAKDDELVQWVGRGVAFAGSLPPK